MVQLSPGTLSATAPERDAAVERLHALLLRAARFEVARRGDSAKVGDLAMEAASDALVTVMSELHTYRGGSSFTTWARKFALAETAVKVRRRSWQGREIPAETSGLARLTGDGTVHAVRDAIAEVLTPHQRAVLVALALNDVPIDVLAERHGTTRGALYETLHDARRKLRAELAKASPGHGSRAA